MRSNIELIEERITQTKWAIEYYGKRIEEYKMELELLQRMLETAKDTTPLSRN